MDNKTFYEEIAKIEKKCGSLYSVGEKEMIKNLIKKSIKKDCEEKNGKSINL